MGAFFRRPYRFSYLVLILADCLSGFAVAVAIFGIAVLALFAAALQIVFQIAAGLFDFAEHLLAFAFDLLARAASLFFFITGPLAGLALGASRGIFHLAL